MVRGRKEEMPNDCTEEKDLVILPQGFFTPRVIKRFPREVGIPALSPVGRTDIPVMSSVRLRIVKTAPALHQIREEKSNVEAELSSLRSAGDPRLSSLRQEQEAIATLEESVVSRSTRLWNGLAGFVVKGRTRNDVASHARLITENLSWLGYRFHSTSFRALPLVEALGPGVPFSSQLSHPLTDEAVGALLPLWEDRLEEKNGVLLGVHASQGTPLFWERFSHQSHSSAIFGVTGSGKTYASAIGWMRLRLIYPQLSIFVLDPLGGLGEVITSMGGTVYRAGTDEVTINPLDPETTGGDVRAKISMALTLLKALVPSLTDEESAVIDTTLSGLYSGRPRTEPPLLGDLYSALEMDRGAPERLMTLLRPALSGSLRHLNHPTEMDLSATLLGFDLSGITPQEMAFHLTLLLDYVYGEMRRRSGPKLLVIDEAHYLTRSPEVSGFLDYLVRHVRHFSGGLELISQNPEDFMGDERSRSVLLNLDSVLLLHLRDGGERVAPLLGLRPEEVAWLKSTALPAISGYAEGIFRTGSLHLPIAVVGTDYEHSTLVKAFDRERVRRQGGK